MQHLLQFLYEHALDRQLYCVIPSDRGELHLTWRAGTPQVSELRHAADFDVEVPRASLLDQLGEQGADLACFERELESLVAADRKSTRLNCSHMSTSYAVLCL